MVNTGPWSPQLRLAGCTLFYLIAAACLLAQAPPPPAPPAAAPAPGDVVEVEAEGEGETREQAVRYALRAALERGGQNEIFSDTKVENFQLMHDTIISRAQGLVKDFKVLREGEVAGGTYKVKIKALVSKSVLAATWAELQNVLNQVGRPRILVWINERIGSEPQEESLLENKIEERLLKSGFDIVARKGIEAIKRKEIADAAAANNVQKLQAMAKDFDAHIFITGTATATPAGMETAYNVPLAMYNCDVQVKMYYTDTAKLLASKSIPNARGGARTRKEYSPQAGKQALENVSRELIDAMYEQVMEQWATAISAGGELVLEIEGMTFGPANRLRKAIQEIERVQQVHMELTKGVARFRINAQLSATDLAEKLSEGEFEQAFEITDLKLNRIQGKVVSP